MYQSYVGAISNVIVKQNNDIITTKEATLEKTVSITMPSVIIIASSDKKYNDIIIHNREIWLGFQDDV